MRQCVATRVPEVVGLLEARANELLTRATAQGASGTCDLLGKRMEIIQSQKTSKDSLTSCMLAASTNKGQTNQHLDACTS